MPRAAITFRIPPALHTKLVAEAKQNNKSLNDWITQLILKATTSTVEEVA